MSTLYYDEHTKELIVGLRSATKFCPKVRVCTSNVASEIFFLNSKGLVSYGGSRVPKGQKVAVGKTDAKQRN
jgi:hypothetical protein